MSSSLVTPGFDRSWFDLNPQKLAIDQEQFLDGIEILTNTPQLAQSHRSLVDYAFQQLHTADYKSWPQVERVTQVVQKFFKEWPLVKIGEASAYLPRRLLERSSQKFPAMLDTDMREALERCIVLEDPENAEIAPLILNYMRTGEITLDNDNVLDLLRFSAEHLMEGLKSQCEAYAAKNLFMDTFNDVLGCVVDFPLPLLKFASLSFIQKNQEDPLFRSLSGAKQELVKLALRLQEHHVHLSFSPEDQPALTLASEFDAQNEAAMQLMTLVNGLVSIRYLEVRRGYYDPRLSQSPYLKTLERAAAILRDVEELIVNVSHDAVDLHQFKRTFPKLRSFGNTAHFLSIEEVEEYLKLFAPSVQKVAADRCRLRDLEPAEDWDLTEEQYDEYQHLSSIYGPNAPAEHGLRLRALHLNLISQEDFSEDETLRVEEHTEEEIGKLSAYFDELYYLTILDGPMTTLDLPKALEVQCTSCSSLTAISAPCANKIDCSNCPALLSLSVPSALEIKCTNCYSLTKLSAPSAKKIDCSSCRSLPTIFVPSAIEIDCSHSSLITLSAPNATKIQATGCRELRTLSLPNATQLSCSHSGFTLISAPNAVDIHCNGCSAVSISAPKALTISCGHNGLLTTISAPNATEISCWDCPELASLDAPSFTHRVIKKIRELVARDERMLPNRYQLSRPIEHNEAFDIEIHPLFPGTLLNDIPYFRAKILEAVILKGNSLLEAKNYQAALQEATYVLGIDRAHSKAERLKSAAMEGLKIPTT